MADLSPLKPPRWRRYQLIAASGAGLLGVSLFIVQAVDQWLFGVDLNFDVLPWVLTGLGLYVLFDLPIPTILRLFGIRLADILQRDIDAAKEPQKGTEE